MSAYKVIKTEFRTLDSLLKALADIGYKEVEVAKDPKNPDLQLVGYLGDTRNERASVRVDRKYVGRASNDIGFAWNSQAKAYEAIISEYDQLYTFNKQKLDRLRQRYAYHEVRRQAKAKGYFVQEETLQEGVIRLQLVRR